MGGYSTPDPDAVYKSDPAFMAASPSDQMKYISSHDPTFASASPQDQLGYIAHLGGTGPVQGPRLPTPGAMNPEVPSYDQASQESQQNIGKAAGLLAGGAALSNVGPTA